MMVQSYCAVTIMPFFIEIPCEGIHQTASEETKKAAPCEDTAGGRKEC